MQDNIVLCAFTCYVNIVSEGSELSIFMPNKDREGVLTGIKIDATTYNNNCVSDNIVIFIKTQFNIIYMLSK